MSSSLISLKLWDAQDDLLACVRCGACLTDCPTYVLTQLEAESPRGRIAMLRAVMEGQDPVGPDLLQHIDNCLVCDACSHVCPAGVDMDPIQVVARNALEARRSRGWRARAIRWLVFGQLLGNIPQLALLTRLLSVYQRSGLQWLVRKSGILSLMGMREAESLLPRVSASPLAIDGHVYHSAVPATGQAALFAGCVMSTALADIDRSTIRVLQRAGLDVTVPEDQLCCGALHAHNGDLPGALEMAKKNIAAFERLGDSQIVVNSAGCGAMLKDYGELFEGDPLWHHRAEAFTRRVKDLSETLFAADSLPKAAPAPEETVVYQDACHLLHAQGIQRQPRDVLRNATGLKLTEIAEPGLCCGSAGVYNVTNPEMARKLRDRKVANCIAVGADTVVTSNPGCLLQLQAGFREAGSDVQVKHMADVLDDATTPR